ncbi:MAG: methyltransferase domain-containing protein, partial [Bryobacteraceae bacterium]
NRLEQVPGAVAGVARDLAALQASVRQQENRLEQVPGAVAGVARDLAALQASVRQQENRLEQLSGAVAELRAAAQRQDEQDENDRLAAGRTADEVESLRAGADHSERALSDLTNRVREAELYAQSIRAELAVERSRVSLLMQQRRQPPSSDAPPSVIGTANLGAELGSLYSQFENAFRGSRAEIKARSIERLPRLRAKGIGGPHMPVLDLGCGRGEWLEVLSENGLTASGVESNAAFVEECRTRGFVVHQGDAIRFLQEALPESQGAITGFHIIEHLQFAELLMLLDEAVRVLKPGGILMLETPNPANLIVGAHTFYLDPTHVRPLPADLMRFLIEARGLCDARIVPLHPFPDSYRLDQDNRAAEVLNDLLYGARDYLVTGERP